MEQKRVNRKEKFIIQFCADDGTILDKTPIELDAHGLDKKDYHYYNEMSKREAAKFEKHIYKLLKKAHEENRDIMLACLYNDLEGESIVRI